MIGKIKDTLTVKYLCVKERVKSHFVNLWKREDGMGVVEVILITVGILTPYYGVSIKCIT